MRRYLTIAILVSLPLSICYGQNNYEYRLDSIVEATRWVITTESYKYSVDGKLSEIIHSRLRQSGDNFSQYRYTFEYDADGRNTKTHEEVMRDGKWNPFRTISTEYDQLGNNTAVNETGPDGTRWFRLDKTYDTNGHLITTEEISWTDDGVEHRNVKYSNTYDDNGRLVEDGRYVKDGNEWVAEIVDKYVYDSLGRKVEIQDFIIHDGIQRKRWLTRYGYDDNHDRLVCRWRYNSVNDGAEWDSLSMTDYYLYDQNDVCVREDTYIDEEHSDSKYLCSQHHVYDQNVQTCRVLGVFDTALLCLPVRYGKYEPLSSGLHEEKYRPLFRLSTDRFSETSDVDSSERITYYYSKLE